jgi:nitroimidazol reductase NimA-like FMN-containing flavoprotein (pyridoxamine 5'-phosphate oxidase superfamily)
MIITETKPEGAYAGQDRQPPLIPGSAPEGGVGCMRREDKSITDPAAIEALPDRAPYCTVALCDGDRGMRYRSVTGSGRASFVTDPEERRAALTSIMRRYAGRRESEFSDARIEKIAVIREALSRPDGKRSGP